MNVAILGRTEWLYDTAQVLRQRGHAIGVVVTSREAPEYRRTVEDFRRLAAECGAAFVESPTLERDDVAAVLQAAGPLDIGVSMNLPSIVRQPTIAAFRLGILNAHGGDLPRYRGNACQAWAMLNGESRIGLCIHRMVGGELDCGDVVARAYRPLTIGDRIGEVLAWIGVETPRLFTEALTQLEADPAYVLDRPSRDPRAGLRCYPRRPEDGRIDWRLSNVEVVRLINASSEPYAGAFCLYGAVPMTVWRAELCVDEERYLAVPGQIAAIEADGAVVVICGRGKLRLREISCNNRRQAPAAIIRSVRTRLS